MSKKKKITLEIDITIYRKFKAQAALQGIGLGKATELLFEEFCAPEKTKEIKKES